MPLFGRPQRPKITETNYNILRDYIVQHGTLDASKKFNISRSNLDWVRRYETYKEMRQAQSELAQKRREKMRATEGIIKNNSNIAPPFEPAAKPPIILPAKIEQIKGENGEVITKPIQEIEGKTAFQWKKAYDALLKEFELLTSHNNNLKVRNEELEKKRNNLRARLEEAEKEIVNYKKQLESLIKGIPQTEASVATPSTSPSKAIIVQVGEATVTIPFPSA